MHLRLPSAVHHRLQVAKTWVGRRIRESLLCRECGERVSPLAEVCGHCGAGNPVKFHVSPALLLTAIASEACLIMLSLR